MAYPVRRTRKGPTLACKRYSLGRRKSSTSRSVWRIRHAWSACRSREFVEQTGCRSDVPIVAAPNERPRSICSRVVPHRSRRGRGLCRFDAFQPHVSPHDGRGARREIAPTREAQGSARGARADSDAVGQQVKFGDWRRILGIGSIGDFLRRSESQARRDPSDIIARLSRPHPRDGVWTEPSDLRGPARVAEG